MIYDVKGPFATEEESPAWRAGLRVGDRLDLAAMRCVPVDTELCASNLALWGGVTYVMPGRKATLLLEGGGRPAGPRSQARRRAAPTHARARRRGAARPDRRRAGRARRGLLGLDPARADDLGLLRLYDLLQPRPMVPVERLAPAMAQGSVRAGRRVMRHAGGGLYGSVALRATRAGRSLRRPLAAARAGRCPRSRSCSSRSRSRVSEAPSAIRPSSPCGPRSCSASRSAPQRSESCSGAARICRRANTSGSAG